MHHVRLQYALIVLSMALPSSLLATDSGEEVANQGITNSLDTSSNQNKDVDRESSLLNEKPVTSESCQDAKKESSLLNSKDTSKQKNDAPRAEEVVKNSAADVKALAEANLAKFIIQYDAGKCSFAAITAEKKAAREYESAFKASLSADNTKQAALAAMHEIAVKQKGDHEIALAVSQLMYDVKTKTHFYNNVTGREQVALATGVAGTSFVAAAIAYRGTILTGIKALASKIAG